MSLHNNLIHRDDVPQEVLDALQQQFPTMRIVCAGDFPVGSMPPSVRAAIDALQNLHAESMTHGTCIDCGAAMPGYKAATIDDGWKPATGWRYYADQQGELLCWQCPACDQAERESAGAAGEV